MEATIAYTIDMMAATKRISTAPVQELARQHGIDNPHALSLEARIAYNTAKRWWYDDPSMTRLETDVLIRLSITLEADPCDLIAIVDVD